LSDKGTDLNKKVKMAIPLCITIVLIALIGFYLITLIQEESSPTVLELFSVDKVTEIESGPWAGLGNLTIRYNGNETLDDMLSIQIHDATTGNEVMGTKTVLFVEPGWNMTIENVNTNVEHVVTLTYKGEVLKLVK
jgi:hypothetical protein